MSRARPDLELPSHSSQLGQLREVQCLAYLLLLVVQELGIPAAIVSTSEPCQHFRSFQAANHEVKHMFERATAQIAGNKCLLHKDVPGVPCRHPERIHSMILGTPCQPFSKLTGKRFQKSCTENHAAYSATFSDTYEAFLAFEPGVVTMEQSSGFNLPYDTETAETPLQRPTAWGWGAQA